jgi:hypothetical protein
MEVLLKFGTALFGVKRYGGSQFQVGKYKLLNGRQLKALKFNGPVINLSWCVCRVLLYLGIDC